jgi:ubiquinone/menaquinone biosynthesis C-methylase UbiE
LLKEMGHCIPTDHAHQVRADYYARLLLKRHEIKRVLDLGCGDGESAGLFHAHPEVQYIGIDLPDAPISQNPPRHKGAFTVYDGFNMPFADGSFDTVYSKQVLEHVAYPHELMREVHRILTGGGYFIGSVSCMEPYHARSLWNMTPYGLYRLVEDAGLKLLEVRPSIDIIGMMIWKAFHLRGLCIHWYLRRSPLNIMIDILYGVAGKSKRGINYAKLMCASQFAFMAQKP